MKDSYQAKFLVKLEEKYGTWNQITSRFGATSFGQISKDLSISPSQFSKLISGTATEGMYIRSIENINRLLMHQEIEQKLQSLEAQNGQIKEEMESWKMKVQRNRRGFIQSGLLGILLGGLLLWLFLPGTWSPGQAENSSRHPLSQYFDRDFQANFNSPYLDINEVQEFCPCSGYEGEWSLSKPYKLPIPATRQPGVYYLARSADVRMKCSRYDSLPAGKGSVLMAYEFLINEIWVDTEHLPFSPLYFDEEKKSYTPLFDTLVFEHHPRFKKVATIHSFFVDKFEIRPDSIIRKGEPYGRFAHEIDEELSQRHGINVKYILENVLGDLTTTNCSAIPNPFCNPNDLEEGLSTMNFDCLYTIRSENLGIGGGYPYQKGYKLVKQMYGDNLTCRCQDSTGNE
ncbi:MAG: hypothetical protein AAFR61_08625 [Bacteroidota bacterium]